MSMYINPWPKWVFNALQGLNPVGPCSILSYTENVRYTYDKVSDAIIPASEWVVMS